jgi:dTDP-4-amino-4,6-dideoxygalactose transaminase
MTAIKPFLLDLTDEEIEAFGRGAADALRSGMLLLGEQTREFEAAFAAYVGTRFAIALSSGAAAPSAASTMNSATAFG